MAVTIRPLTLADRAAWEPLWQGYLTFYKASMPPEVTDNSWRRFHDPASPSWALGAFEGEKMLGLVHYLSHISNWYLQPIIYLQDLFTVPEARGKGVGRSLIEAVYAEAKKMGVPRVYWQTHETNLTAQALYDKVAEKSGFIVYRQSIGG